MNSKPPPKGPIPRQPSVPISEEVRAAIEVTAERVVAEQEIRENESATAGWPTDPTLLGPLRDRPRHESHHDMPAAEEPAPREISGSTRVPLAVLGSALVLVATMALAWGQQRSELQSVKGDAAMALIKAESKADRKAVEDHESRLRIIEEDKAATAAKLQAIQTTLEKQDRKLDRLLERTK
jgi:hypothetical protein